ncbi:MAG: phage antirepressor protein [Clostridia bacterium]|jgi:anti-repressor protein|nr:phage antirepressor protein [Clostridia bacterium]
MNELQIFKNEDFGEIRTKNINNIAYVCLADICKILDIKNVGDCRNRLNQDGIVTTDTVDKLGRKNQAIFINESNLYKVIFQSRKLEAERFTEWVTSEVLPNIRKKGAYLTEQKIEEVLSNPDTIIKLATDLKREREEKQRLQIENTQKNQIIGELKPKADYTDLILQSKNTLTVTAIAKDYGMSAIEFNKKLHDLKIQYRQSNQWFLYEKYQRCGYTHSKTTNYVRNDGTTGTKLNTEWTQKGRLFLYNKLKECGIVPLIEK